MFDIREMDKPIERNHIKRIYKLFDKPSIIPVPNMERERVYSDYGKPNKLLNDVMIYRDKKLLVVRWKTINEKTEFAKGISFYFAEEKIKISALYKENGDFVKYYCEVVEVDYNNDIHKYIFRDLIVDVNLYENGKYEVLDEDQLNDALKDKKNDKVTPDKSDEILAVKDDILRKIHEGQILPEWCIKKVENQK